MNHTPLHLVPENTPVLTAGRLDKCEHRWRVFNAHCTCDLQFGDLSIDVDRLVDGSLARIKGRREGSIFDVEQLHVVHVPQQNPPPLAATGDRGPGPALRARHQLYRTIHRFFDTRDFLEVRTRAWLRAPGTDPHLDAVQARFRPAPDDEGVPAYLHTSPELPMKRLLCAGSGPIYQLGRAWRNGEVTPLHNPEFDLLEWYRPWRDVDAIIDDVEALTAQILDSESARPVTPPIERMTMQQVVDAACGFDILEALDAESLRRQIEARDLLSDRAMKAATWDELFFSLTISHLDPFLDEQGAVFVTDWPRPLAILARQDDGDPRVAERFELYVDGVELANGFGELTDPDEQRARFAQDNADRRRLDLPTLPIPRAFLNALRWGLPPGAGVALGIDRLLMLATFEAESLRDIQPFAVVRDVDGIQWP